MEKTSVEEEISQEPRKNQVGFVGIIYFNGIHAHMHNG